MMERTQTREARRLAQQAKHQAPRAEGTARIMTRREKWLANNTTSPPALDDGPRWDGWRDWDSEPTDEEYDEDDGIVYSATIPCPRCGEKHPC